MPIIAINTGLHKNVNKSETTEKVEARDCSNNKQITDVCSMRRNTACDIFRAWLKTEMQPGGLDWGCSLLN